VLQMDILGSALAQIFARAVGALAALAFLFLPRDMPIRLRLEDVFSFQRPILSTIMEVSVPFGLEQLFLAFGGIVLTAMTVPLGTGAVVVNSIAGSLMGVTTAAAGAAGNLGITMCMPVKENGEELPDFAANLDIPVVAITKPAAALDAVYVDHRSAGALVAEHLAERGYRRFLFIGEEYDRKYLGFREKLAERGLAERTGSVAYESDRQLTHFLETWLRRPGGRTAVFAGNDIFALRTLSALRMLEVSVPRQAGVIGFDDTSTGRYLRPALSSVSQPIAAMAGEAVSRLLWRIDHPRAEEILDLALPAELVVRESA